MPNPEWAASIKSAVRNAPPLSAAAMRVVTGHLQTADERLLEHARHVAEQVGELSPEKAAQARRILTGEDYRVPVPALPSRPLPPPLARPKSAPRRAPDPVLAGVYFVRAGDLIKVGTSTNVHQRVAQLRTMSPVSLELLAVAAGGHEEEAIVHRLFHRFRQHGEWFKATPELLAYIAEVNP